MANEGKFKIGACEYEYYEYIDIGFVVEESSILRYTLHLFIVLIVFIYNIIFIIYVDIVLIWNVFFPIICIPNACSEMCKKYNWRTFPERIKYNIKFLLRNYYTYANTCVRNALNLILHLTFV